MLTSKNKPFDLATAKDSYKTYRDKPALFVKDHPELKDEISKNVDLTNNFEMLGYYTKYNNWLLDWCFSCLE